MNDKLINILENTDVQMIENAINESVFNELLLNNNLKEYARSTEEFFVKNYISDLNWYKCKKHSGHKIYVIYKKVCIVAIYDCMDSITITKIKNKLSEIKDWSVHSEWKLMMYLLIKLFGDSIYDKRYKITTIKNKFMKIYTNEIEPTVIDFYKLKKD